jgi:NAD kinase
MRVVGGEKEGFLTLDGQQRIDVTAQDVIEIERHEHPLRLVVLDTWNYYELLKDKLNWGERPIHDRERV